MFNVINYDNGDISNEMAYGMQQSYMSSMARHSEYINRHIWFRTVIQGTGKVYELGQDYDYNVGISLPFVSCCIINKVKGINLPMEVWCVTHFGAGVLPGERTKVWAYDFSGPWCAEKKSSFYVGEVNLMAGVRFLKELKNFEKPIIFAVTEYLGNMLKKLGWNYITTKKANFHGEMVDKVVYSSIELPMSMKLAAKLMR